jgi:uncharacterized Zn-binding protein involved in type VI secretion
MSPARAPIGSPQAAPPATTRPSQVSAVPPAPLINPTGHVALDSLANVINTAAAPFIDPPPAHETTLQAISRHVNSVLGVTGAAFGLLDTGLAMITAPLAKLVPAMPAVTIGCMYVGPPHCHAHPPSLIPPNPVPVPLPSLGTIMMAGAVTVLIGGVPAARCGDYGLAPTCMGFMPILEVKTGSSQVFIGGSRAARLTDFAKACPGPPEPPDVPKPPPSAFGMAMKGLGIAGIGAGALGAAASGKTGAAVQAAADAAAMAMGAMYGKDPSVPPVIASLGMVLPMQATVLIGGFPMPNSLEVVMGLIKGVSLLAKGLRGGRRAGKLFCLKC